MSQQTENQMYTLVAAEDLEAYRRVKLDSTGKAVYADAGEPAVGITQKKCVSGAPVAVRLLPGVGTFKVVCSQAVAALSTLFGTADGKVNDVSPAGSPGAAVGIALAAGSGDGSVIECLPLGMRTVCGQHTTVAAADTIVTGLAKVYSVVAQLDDDPVDGVMHVTSSIGDQAGAPAAGSVILKSWKSTDGDATLIAGTTFGKKVNWIALGV